GILWHRLYNGETAYDFIGKSRRWFVLSGVVILAGLVSLFTRGLNQGIDFKGGTSWEVKAPHVSVAKARDALRPIGLAEAKIQILGSDTLRVQSHISEGTSAASKASADKKRSAVTDRLRKLSGGREVSINDVGPSWGKDVTHKAERALVFFFIAILGYISLRFEWKMAVAEHVAGGHPPDHVGAGGRGLRAGRHRAAGLRAGPPRRPAHRGVLVHLHRLAASGLPQGARAALRHHPSAPGRQGRHDRCPH